MMSDASHVVGKQQQKKDELCSSSGVENEHGNVEILEEFLHQLEDRIDQVSTHDDASSSSSSSSLSSSKSCSKQHHSNVPKIAHHASIIGLMETLGGFSSFDRLLDCESEYDTSNVAGVQEFGSSWCEESVFRLRDCGLPSASTALHLLVDNWKCAKTVALQLPYLKSTFRHNPDLARQRGCRVFALTEPERVLRLLFCLAGSGDRSADFELGTISKRLILQHDTLEATNALRSVMLSHESSSVEHNNSSREVPDQNPWTSMGVSQARFESEPNGCHNSSLGDVVLSGKIGQLVGEHTSSTVPMRPYTTQYTSADKLHQSKDEMNDESYSLTERVANIPPLPLIPPSLFRTSDVHDDNETQSTTTVDDVWSNGEFACKSTSLTHDTKLWRAFDRDFPRCLGNDCKNTNAWDEIVDDTSTPNAPAPLLKRRQSSIMSLLAEPMKKHWLFEKINETSLPNAQLYTHIGDRHMGGPSSHRRRGDTWEEQWICDEEQTGLASLGFVTAQDATVFAEHYNQHFALSAATSKTTASELVNSMTEHVKTWAPLQLSSSSETPSASVVREGVLVLDTIAVLQAVPSRTYCLKHTPSGMPFFEIRPCRLLLSGVSSLRSLLQQFAYYGSLYAYLDNFSQYFFARAQFGGGLIRQAFAHAVNDYLRIYRVKIMDVGNAVQRRRTVQKKMNDINVHSDIPATIIEMCVHSRTLTFQLKWLAELCGYSQAVAVSDASLTSPSVAEASVEANAQLYQSFPKGAALLSYLYSCGRTIGDGSVDLLLKFLFKRAMQPYLTMLTAWVYRGELDDPCGEFLVGERSVIVGDATPVSKRQLRRLGLQGGAGPVDVPTEWDCRHPHSVTEVPTPMRRFHQRGNYTLPSFLRSVVEDIFLCGQTLHILRIAAPLYYECCAVGTQPSTTFFVGNTVSSLARANPPTQLCFTLMELETVRSECERIAMVQCEALSELHNKYVEKVESMVKAEMDELHQRVDEFNAYRQRTKENRANAEILRKQAQQAYRQQLDDQVMDKQQRLKEEMVRNEEDERQKHEEQMKINAQIDQEKERLQREHQRLMHASDRRESILRWRTRRMMLQNRRVEFWKNDKHYWQEHPPSPSSASVRREQRKLLKSGNDGSDDDHQSGYDFDAFVPVSAKKSSHKRVISFMGVEVCDDLFSPSSVGGKGTDGGTDAEVVVEQNEQHTEQEQVVGGAADDIDECEGPVVDRNANLEDGDNVLIPSFGFDVVAKDGENVDESSNVDNNDKHVQYVESDMESDDDDEVMALPPQDAQWENQRLNVESFDDAMTEFDSSLMIGASTYKGILDTIASQHRVVNQACLRFFYDELQFLKQIDVLRRYYFFCAGDVMDAFATALFKGLAAVPPVNWGLQINLERSLESAFKQCGVEDDVFACCWRFESVSDAHTPKSPTKVLEDIRLKYVVTWPMSIVITPEAISSYQSVFTFFLKVKAITADLRDLWILFKELKSSRVMHRGFVGVPDDWSMHDEGARGRQRTGTLKVSSVSYGEKWHQLEMYRSEMQHLVNTLEQYLITQVLEVSWAEFQKHLQKVEDIYEVRAAHLNYLTRCVNRCFLGEKTKVVMSVIQPIFDYILQFKQLVTQFKTSPQMMNSNWQRVLRVVTNFRKYTNFFYNVLRKLALKGFQHMQTLVMCLDYNGYYKRGPRFNTNTL